MTDIEISNTMRRAIGMAAMNGNKLYRHPGGFWAGPDWKHQLEPSFGTKTMSALVRRELASYSKTIKGKHGDFPVEIELAPHALELATTRSRAKS